MWYPISLQMKVHILYAENVNSACWVISQYYSIVPTYFLHAVTNNCNKLNQLYAVLYVQIQETLETKIACRSREPASFQSYFSMLSVFKKRSQTTKEKNMYKT